MPDMDEIQMILRAMREYANERHEPYNNKNNNVSSTNSEIGSYHWFHTIVANHKDIGEFLSQRKPTDEILREWGRRLFETSKELINGYTALTQQIETKG